VSALNPASALEETVSTAKSIAEAR